MSCVQCMRAHHHASVNVREVEVCGFSCFMPYRDQNFHISAYILLCTILFNKLNIRAFFDVFLP